MAEQTTYTVRDVVTAALRLISVTDANETLDGPMASQALYTFQEILDSWNVDGGMIYAQSNVSFPILSQKNIYSIGPEQANPGQIQTFNYDELIPGSGYTQGTYTNLPFTGGSGVNATGNFIVDYNGKVVSCTLYNAGNDYQISDTLSASIPGGSGFSIQVATVSNSTDFVVDVRPQNLLWATFSPTDTAPPIDLELQIIDSIQWAQIVSKQIGSGVPTKIYLNQDWPIGNIHLWNQPNQGGTLNLVYWQLLPSTSLTLDSIIQNTFPPGYWRLLRYELAMNLAPEYGKPIPADIAAIVEDIKRNIIKNNTTSEWAQYDCSFAGPRVYDIVSGQSYG